MQHQFLVFVAVSINFLPYLSPNFQTFPSTYFLYFGSVEYLMFIIIYSIIKVIDTRLHVWSFIHSHFLCKILNVVCAYYFIIFLRFVKNFLYYFFQKQASKDCLTQGNLLKTTLLNEILKRKCMEIFLYTPNIFHLGQEWMFAKYTFTF